MTQASDAPILVAIIEDQHEIREGLAILIDGTEGFRCTGRYGSMEDALARIGTDLPDVALVDIGLPGMSGIEGISILRKSHPSLRLLMLTVYDDDDRIVDFKVMIRPLKAVNKLHQMMAKMLEHMNPA